MENATLEGSATCGQPPELKGQKVKDVQIFKSCPGLTNTTPPPRSELTVDLRAKKAKKLRPNLSQPAEVKTKPSKPKVKPNKAIKKQPQRKTSSSKYPTKKDKKTLG